MSAIQSNLSNPNFDYDLVVAMTQKSVNTGLKSYLDKATAPEVRVCFVTKQRKWELIPYEELKQQAKGSCPFTPRDGADPDTDTDLINLKNAHYAGGFVAQIGFPDMDDPKSLNVVTLKGGTDSENLHVDFNLLCRKFQITGFLYDSDGASWINQSQPDTIPAGHLPWVFGADVRLGKTVIDPGPHLPPAVLAKVNQLQAGTFSLQQMFLDLETALGTSTNLTLKGVDTASALYIEITAVFVKHYVEQMKKNGQPVLGYAVTMNNPDLGTMHLGALSREVCPLLDPSGNVYPNPTPDQRELATFNYLCTTKKVPPTVKAFPWNWVEPVSRMGLLDSDAISGIQAFRRSSFGAILASALGGALDPRFCLATGARFERPYPGTDYWSFHFGLTFPGHCTFVVKPAPAQKVQPSVFVPLLDFSYQNNEVTESDWIGSSLNAVNIKVTVNYSFSGTVSLGVKQDEVPYIRVEMHAVAQLHLEHWEVTWATHYNDFPLDKYVDYTVSIDMPMKVDSSGARLIVEPGKPTVQSNSAPYSYWHEGVHPDLHQFMEPYLKRIIKTEDDTIRGGFEYISQTIEGAVNNANGFVFPGGKTFAFSHLSLSDYQDLIIHVGYVDVA